MPNRPQTDPLADSLADFSEAERDVAMSRFQALRPHVQDGATLTEARIERRGKTRNDRQRQRDNSGRKLW